MSGFNASKWTPEMKKNQKLAVTGQKCIWPNILTCVWLTVILSPAVSVLHAAMLMFCFLYFPSESPVSEGSVSITLNSSPLTVILVNTTLLISITSSILPWQLLKKVLLDVNQGVSLGTCPSLKTSQCSLTIWNSLNIIIMITQSF